jgi:hypothetical protein
MAFASTPILCSWPRETHDHIPLNLLPSWYHEFIVSFKAIRQNLKQFKCSPHYKFVWLLCYLKPAHTRTVLSWDVMQWILVEVHRRLGEMFCLLPRGWIVNRARKQATTKQKAEGNCTQANVCQCTRRHIPGASSLHSDRRENVRSRTVHATFLWFRMKDCCRLQVTRVRGMVLTARLDVGMLCISPQPPWSNFWPPEVYNEELRDKKMRIKWDVTTQ